jgi:chemotaxis protein methyltransferase CheR
MLAVERTDRANDDCGAFLQWALPRLALNWPGFRRVRRQVCRRLKRRMQSLGLSDFAAYRAHVRAYPEEWAVIDGFCRITISRFLRDKGIFAALGASVLPAMAQRASADGRGVAAWSAGCASGEEAYSLKIVWEQCVAPGMPAVAFSVLGTDVDKAVLDRARRGCYAAATLRELPGAWVAQSFDIEDDHYCVKNALREGVSFVRQDIRIDLPPGPFDLILCRNLAFTYFDVAQQVRTLRHLETHLRNDGVLVIGAHERLPEGATNFLPLPQCPYILGWRGAKQI